MGDLEPALEASDPIQLSSLPGTLESGHVDCTHFNRCLLLGRGSFVASSPRIAAELLCVSALFSVAVLAPETSRATPVYGTSALGELVYEVAAARRSIVDREVFRSLVPQIEALADTLPGAHPFLRRSMKRLARELQN